MLEEAHRGARVVQVPAEARVVEVDDADPAVVHEQVGQPGVGVDEAVPAGAGAERGQPGAQGGVEPPQHLAFRRADADPVLPAAPARLGAERRVVVPVEPGEPGRAGPAPGVLMHAGGDLAELGEMLHRVTDRLGAGQELEPHAVAPLTAGLVGRGHDPAAVGGGQHPRRAHPGLGPQRVHPGQLGGDRRLGVVAVPVHPQDRGPGIGVFHQVGGVLRDVEQADGGGGVAAVGGERLLRAPGDPLQHITGGRQIVKLHARHPSPCSRPSTAPSTAAISCCARSTSGVAPLM